MKFGLRTPSLKRRIAARTSWKRVVRHSIGLKAPKGMGFVTNPKKAMYNKVYNKTSFSADSLFKTGKKKTSSTKGSWSLLLNILIFLILAFTFFPLAVVFLIYKLYRSNKAKKSQVITGEQQPQQEQDIQLSVISQNNKNNSLFAQFQIPEPTKSLLWITDEDTSKISSPMQIRIEVKIGKKGVETVDDSYNFFSEPSLIWTRLPLQPNHELETQKMYYPTYSGLSPVHRFQYLNWLTDITKDTNLSYVFLYYYGLERHLLVGNYDLAIEEILRLIQYHDKGTFKGYAINALILGSGYRKRPEIIEKAPFILDEASPVSLYLQRMAHKALSADHVISLSNRVGFTNKRYLNEFPELFKKELQNLLDTYQMQHGDILQSIDISSLPSKGWASMANISIPDNIRTIKFPSILESESFKTALKELLTQTHLKIKTIIADKKLKSN